MKVDLQSKLNYYTPIIDSKRQMPHSSSSRKASRNFDGITIQSGIELNPEQQFADALTSRLSLEIRKPVSPNRIQDLQQQIDQGTYQIDINCIADKIMLV